MRLIDADALTEFLKCLLPKRGMWEIEGDTAKDAICETVAEAIEMVKNMETIQPAKAQLSQEGTTKGTTSDPISRQEAIDIVDDVRDCISVEGYWAIVERIGKLPTAQPEPKIGRWIPHETPDGGEQYECSRCGVLWEFNDGSPEDNEAYFCPKCGSYLGGGQK